MPITPQHDPLKPTVAARADIGQIILVCKNEDNGHTSSIRFNKKYIRRLVLDLLDMEESLEVPKP